MQTATPKPNNRRARASFTVCGMNGRKRLTVPGGAKKVNQPAPAAIPNKSNDEIVWLTR